MINHSEFSFFYFFIGLFLLLACALFYMGTVPFSTPYEEPFIELATIMVNTGNWSQPLWALEQGLNPLPPLAYWFSAAGHWLFPGSLLGFRFFHILTYLFAFPVFFLIVRFYQGARTAFYSSCILASSLYFSWHNVLATPDGLAAIFIGLSLIGFYQYLKTNEKRYFWLIYTSMALGMLAKGLIAIILPLLMLVLYLMFKIKMNSESLKKIELKKGMLFTLVIGLPWFLYGAWKAGADYLLQFLNTIYWYSSVSPDATTSEGAFYLPFIFIILVTLPFGFYLPKSFGYSWKFRHKKPLLLISALSLLLTLVFFAFSDLYYPHYLLPAIPFTALLIGFQISQLQGRPLSKMNLYVGIAGTLLLSIVPVLGYLLLKDIFVAGSEGIHLILFLSILPLGTFICFGLWQFKRTDEGMAVLTFSYLLFNVLLLQWGVSSAQLMEYLKVLIL